MDSSAKKSNWRWKLPFLLLLILGSIFIIRRHQPENSTPYQQTEGAVFGTIWHATYQFEKDLKDDILEELKKVDQSLSMFNPQSTLSLINSGENDEIDSLLQTVLIQAIQISKATNGCFDVTVAPLVNAWGFGFKRGTRPDSTQVDSILQFVGYDKITINGNRLVKADERMVLDFSAIAKGFSVDQVANLFRKKGIHNFMIEIGGEIVVSGNNPKGKPWLIGVNKPVDDATHTQMENQANLRITNCAMATSGNYRNYYIGANGKKLAHTIDPHTGYPVQHSILSSTVFAPTCAMADAFATSFMVMGIDHAREVLAQQPQLQAYFILSDDNGDMYTCQTDSLTKFIVK